MRSSARVHRSLEIAKPNLLKYIPTVRVLQAASVAGGSSEIRFALEASAEHGGCFRIRQSWVWAYLGSTSMRPGCVELVPTLTNQVEHADLDYSPRVPGSPLCVPLAAGDLASCIMFMESLTGKSGGRDFDYPIGRGLSARLWLHESWLNASCSSWKVVPVLANVDGPDSDYALCAWLCGLLELHEYEIKKPSYGAVL